MATPASSLLAREGPRPDAQEREYAILADQFETKERVIIQVDVPGLSKADVKVRVAEGHIVVTGRRGPDQECKNASFAFRERSIGSFTRRFKVPQSCDTTNVIASTLHGVLTITLNKTAPFAPSTASAATGVPISAAVLPVKSEPAAKPASPSLGKSASPQFYTDSFGISPPKSLLPGRERTFSAGARDRSDSIGRERIASAGARDQPTKSVVISRPKSLGSKEPPRVRSDSTSSTHSVDLRTEETGDVTIHVETQGDGALNSIFHGMPISIFPKPSIGKAIPEALRILSECRILAAPVRDVSKPPETPWTEKYLGLIDVSAVVAYMLDKLGPTGHDSENFQREIESISEFKNSTLADVAKLLHLQPFAPIEVDKGNLLDAMLLCGPHNLRRIPVVKTPGGDVVNIITQSALVKVLANNMDKLKSVGRLSLQDLGIGSRAPVHSVSKEDKLFHAFHLIREHDISAVPVIDSVTGRICGNVSARDVRLVATSSKVYKMLNMPIKLYLDIVNEGAENSAITCTPDDRLEDVIKRMVKAHIHRIYVVDDGLRMIRVLSLRNIICRFVKEPPNYFGRFFG